MNLADENEVAALLVRYGFDLGGQSAHALVRSWNSKYDSTWLPIAIVESLHLGRYKAVSVEQILNAWQRRGQTTPHFNSEFATMVVGQDVMATDSPDSLIAITTEESLLDAEIASFSVHDIAEVYDSTTGLELSDPALDEGILEQIVNMPHQLFVSTQHQVSLDLTPTAYPPSQPRPPHQEWPQTEPLADVFTPSAQVSQFYYKLRAMALPTHHPLEEQQIAADG